MTNLENTGSSIRAAVDLLPVQMTEEAVTILGAQQEKLAHDLPGPSRVCEPLGQAAARLAEAGSLLAGAGSCIKGYLENIGLASGGVAAVYNIPETKAEPGMPAARGGIELPATDGLPDDIAQAIHAVYGLFCLPYEASRDDLYRYVSMVRQHSKAINACMSREDTVDWMLDALNTVGTKKIFEQTDEFGDMCSYRELFYDGDVDDCIGRLEIMAQNADMQRLERIMRFATNMGPSLRCSWRTEGLVGRFVSRLASSGRDLTYLSGFLRTKKYSHLVSRVLIPPSDLSDLDHAKKVWSQKAALALRMRSAFTYADIRHQTDTLFKDALERLRVSAADMFDTEMLAGIMTTSHGYHTMREYISDDSAISNILAMGEVERCSPGASEQLYKRFGIRQFAKNSIQQLVAQNDFYNELLRRQKAGETAQETPWIAAAASLQDDPGDKGAFNERAEWFKKTKAQIEEATGQAVTVCVFEFSSPKEIVHSMGRMRWIARQAGPAIFGALHSHGRADGFETGLGEPRVTLSNISEIFGRQLSRILAPGATLLMNSCSTGKPGGVAEHIRNTAGRRVVAPTIPDNISKMAFSNSAEGLNVDVEYYRGDTVRAVYERS